MAYFNSIIFFFTWDIYTIQETDTINDVDKIFESVKSDGEAFIKDKIKDKIDESK